SIAKIASTTTQFQTCMMGQLEIKILL
ncbi:uncharacterized protein METZ01_LOCUS406353, partial [marine metagenome]